MWSCFFLLSCLFLGGKLAASSHHAVSRSHVFCPFLLSGMILVRFQACDRMIKNSTLPLPLFWGVSKRIARSIIATSGSCKEETVIPFRFLFFCVLAVSEIFQIFQFGFFLHALEVLSSTDPPPHLFLSGFRVIQLKSFRVSAESCCLLWSPHWPFLSYLSFSVSMSVCFLLLYLSIVW